MNLFPGEGQPGIVDGITGLPVAGGDPSRVPPELMGNPSSIQQASSNSWMYGNTSAGALQAAPQAAPPQYQQAAPPQYQQAAPPQYQQMPQAPQAPQYQQMPQAAPPQYQQYAPAPQQTPQYAPQAQAPLQYQQYAPAPQQTYQTVSPADEAAWAAYALKGENDQLKARLGTYDNIEAILEQHPEYQQQMFDLLSGRLAPAQAQQVQQNIEQASQAQGQTAPQFNAEMARLQSQVQQMHRGYGQLQTEMQLQKLANTFQDFDRTAVVAYAQRNGINDPTQAYYALKGAWDTFYPGWREQQAAARGQVAPQGYQAASQYQPAPQYFPQGPPQGYGHPGGQQPGYGGQYVPQGQPGFVQPYGNAPQHGGYNASLYGPPQAGYQQAVQRVEVPNGRAGYAAQAVQAQGPPASREEGVERMVRELEQVGFRL